MHILVHEDNAGCLVLAKMEPPQMTPQLKHYGTKYHWFREKLKPNGIQLYKIDTERQLGDICTKGLRREAFERIRKFLMGW